MIDTEKSASAHLPVTRVWLERGEALATAAAGVARGIDAWLARRLSAFEGARARRAARRELYRLDDRLLNDIGLRREQVSEFVDGMFRGNSEAARRPAVAMMKADAVAEHGARNDGHFKTAA